jgi:hypothetical protein
LAATHWLRHDGRRSLVVANGKFSILDALATITIGDPAITIPISMPRIRNTSRRRISMRSFPRCSQTAALITLSPPDHKRFQGRSNQAAGPWTITTPTAINELGVKLGLYDFGVGDFSVELRAHDPSGAPGTLPLAVNKIMVHVKVPDPLNIL